YADNGGGVLSLHHGLYNDVDNGQNKDILANELFGAHSTQSGWSATLTDYTVHSTNYGHFISSYLIEYEEASVDPESWNSNPLSLYANTGFSTTHTFGIYDELYNNMAFTGTVDLGRHVGDITPLFSNDRSTNSIAHTTGFTRIVDFNEDETVGKVVYFEIGERKENYTTDSRFGQLIRNSVIWAAPDREVLEPLEQTISFEPSQTEFTYGDESFALTGFSSSGLALTYLSSDENILSVSGSMVSITGTGTTTITATQEGDSEYAPAEDVVVEFTVSRAELVITADAQNKIYGEANPTLTMSFDGFVYDEDQSDMTLPLLSTSATTQSDVLEGGYPIVLSGGSADNYELTLVNGVLTIE
ncbi:MAG: MBG domain-containing protein, partial [Cyclobacteriaceae bacterium]